MILKGKIKVLAYKTKSFKARSGTEVTFNEILFCDDEGNKFNATVPKANVNDVELVIDSADTDSIEGDAEIQASKATSDNGKSYVKFQVVKFNPLKD